MSGLILSQALLWIVIAALCMVVLALARQIGVLHERIAPVGALVVDNGPGVGQLAPRFEMRTLDGAPYTIGGATTSDGLRLLLFVAADCPICKRIVPIARNVARAEALTLVLVGDGALAPLRKMRERLDIAAVTFVHGAEIGVALHVGKLPYAVLIDAQSVIRAKGLVNSREHLESLLVAHETGHATVQSFMGRREMIDAAR
jgi:methylamine dehydrogenase accessory protein MauD